MKKPIHYSVKLIKIVKYPITTKNDKPNLRFIEKDHVLRSLMSDTKGEGKTVKRNNKRDKNKKN